MMTRRLLGVVLLTSICGTAWAGPKDFVIYVPGLGNISAQQAQPYLETLFRELEKQMKWPAGSASGEYLEDPTKLVTYLETKKPGFGMLAAPKFLELACKKMQVEPIAQVEYLTSRGTGRYHLMVKGDAVKDLKGLHGKTLASNHLKDAKFVSRVIFEDKVDAAKEFVLKPTPSPLKPVRQLEAGEVDAALIDDTQLELVKKSPKAAEIHEVFTSPLLPAAPVVAFQKVVKPAERDAVRKGLIELCTSPSGQAVCKSLQIKRFEPIDAGAFRTAIKSYCR